MRIFNSRPGKIVTFFFLILLGVLSRPAHALIYYDFAPSPANLYNLDHFQYYLWGIQWQPGPKETIVSAKLSIKDINNWTPETNDKLFIHLLDTVASGVHVYTDNQGGGDNIASLGGNQVLLDTYSDPLDAPNDSDANKFVNAENYVYNFTAENLNALKIYDQNGNFGFGFDPDCHYWNHGVLLTLGTQTVSAPEPVTPLLLAIGLAGAGLIRKKFRTP